MSTLLSVPIAFIIFLLAAFLVYHGVRALGPKKKDEGRKLDSYTCGEDIPEIGRKVQHSYYYFHFAFVFTILHVVALIIATVPSGIVALLGIGYLSVAIISVVILLVD
jgi:NADH:ubiquinone oxidoreductase subunit 3 (subunit A)